jgi:hypothetical protein
MQIAALTGSVGRLAGLARSETPGLSAPVAQERPQEPYLSPVFRFDKQARVVIFQFRDSETGDVTRQYPSERVVKLYRNSAPPDTTGTPTETGSETTADTRTRAAPAGSTGTSDVAATPVEAPATGTGSEPGPSIGSGSSAGAGGDRVRLDA